MHLDLRDEALQIKRIGFAGMETVCLEIARPAINVVLDVERGHKPEMENVRVFNSMSANATH